MESDPPALILSSSTDITNGGDSVRWMYVSPPLPLVVRLKVDLNVGHPLNAAIARSEYSDDEKKKMPVLSLYNPY